MAYSYTTGQVALICGFSQQSAIRCIDAGLLRGYRVPGTRHRRVAHEDLARFMEANDIPTHRLPRDGPPAPAPPTEPDPEPEPAAAAPSRRMGKKGGGRRK